MQVILVGILLQFLRMPESCKSNGQCMSQEGDIRATYYAIDGSSEVNVSSSSADTMSEARSNDVIADTNNPPPQVFDKIEEDNKLTEVMNTDFMAPMVSNDMEIPEGQTQAQPVSDRGKNDMSDKTHVGQFNNVDASLSFSQAMKGSADAIPPHMSLATPTKISYESSHATPKQKGQIAATMSPVRKINSDTPSFSGFEGKRILGTYPKSSALAMMRSNNASRNEPEVQQNPHFSHASDQFTKDTRANNLSADDRIDVLGAKKETISSQKTRYSASADCSRDKTKNFILGSTDMNNVNNHESVNLSRSSHMRKGQEIKTMMKKESLLGHDNTQSSRREQKPPLTQESSDQESSIISDEMRDRDGWISDLQNDKKLSDGFDNDFEKDSHIYGSGSDNFEGYDQHDENDLSDGNNSVSPHDVQAIKDKDFSCDEKLDDCTQNSFKKAISQEMTEQKADMIKETIRKHVNSVQVERRITDLTHEVFVQPTPDESENDMIPHHNQVSPMDIPADYNKANRKRNQRKPSLVELREEELSTQQGTRRYEKQKNASVVMEDLDQHGSNTSFAGSIEMSEIVQSSDVSPKRGNPFTPREQGQIKRQCGGRREKKINVSNDLLSASKDHKKQFFIHTREGSSLSSQKQSRISAHSSSMQDRGFAKNHRKTRGKTEDEAGERRERRANKQKQALIEPARKSKERRAAKAFSTTENSMLHRAKSSQGHNQANNTGKQQQPEDVEMQDWKSVGTKMSREQEWEP